MDFLFKIHLFIVRWTLGSNKEIMNCYNLNVLCIEQMYYITTKNFSHDANGLSKSNQHYYLCAWGPLLVGQGGHCPPKIKT